MKITNEVIKSVGFETELPELSIKYLQEALDQVQPDADHTECLKSWEKRAGIELKKSEQPKEPVVSEKGM